MAHDESADLGSAGLQPLAYQVGGHKNGVQVIGDGALIVKAVVPLELQFYQSTLANPALAALRQWVPTHIGMLRLEGQNTAEGFSSVEGIPENERDKYSPSFLENVVHGFRKPNILDIKLGTLLYDEDAPPEKKAKMEAKTRNTTSGEVGIRLTGFQVFGNKTSQPLVVPKAYGRSICSAELPAGIARFFPVYNSMIGLPGTHPGGPMDVGLPGTLLLPILRFIRKSVQELRDVLSSIDLRLIGSSLLIVYEGDWERAELGVEWLDKHLESTSNDEERKEEEIDEDGEGSGEDVEGSEEGAEEGSEDDGEDWDSLCRPEPGVLKGLDALLGLLDGRIAVTSCSA
ncbi:hypothetical protein BC826DRAFT_981787 [Russula brevipes]|nr:hypothetical protein BC826DRAFT_981787 [Russula brevipes]